MKKIGWLILLILVLVASTALAGNTADSALNIEVNTLYEDQIESKYDVRYYKFTLPTNGCLSFQFNHDYADSSGNLWTVELRDETDKLIFSNSFKGNVTENTTPHYGIPDGTYYVRIKYSGSASNVSFGFSVVFDPSDYWETENNKDLISADPIMPNAYYNGVIWSTSDYDYYVFTLPSAGYVSVSFRHDYVETSSSVWTTSILNEQRNIFLNTSFKGNVQEEETTHNFGLPAGTYYVKLNSSQSFSNGDYHFRINYSQSDFWETEFNEKMTEATNINVNEYYYGTSRSTSDIDYYRFTVPKDGELSILFKHEAVTNSNSDTYWKSAVYDAQSKQYASASYKGSNDEEEQSAKFSLAAGTYYLKVEDSARWSGADYRFKVTYEIPKISITDATYESIDDQVYTGKTIKPDVKIELNGKQLIRNTDYKLSYKKNLNVGTATVTVTGIGDYAGSIKITFRILPKAVKLSSVVSGKKSLKLNWSKGGDVTGFQIEYSLKKDFSNSKKVTVTGSSVRSKVIKELKSGKTYYVRIRVFKKVSGKKYYSAWSNVKNAKTK